MFLWSFLLAAEGDSALKDTMWCWRKNDDSHYRVKWDENTMTVTVWRPQPKVIASTVQSDTFNLEQRKLPRTAGTPQDIHGLHQITDHTAARRRRVQRKNFNHFELVHILQGHVIFFSRFSCYSYYFSCTSNTLKWVPDSFTFMSLSMDGAEEKWTP